MKISSAIVRRLRTEHGWSQDQLAAASGVSLRTIQRVEAEGTASRETKVSLAATFNVALAELDGECNSKPVSARNWLQDIVVLFLGLTVLTCVLVSESGRLPGLPGSDGLAVLDAVLAAAGALLTIPTGLRLVFRRRYASVVLAVLGTPVVVLNTGALCVALLSGRHPAQTFLGVGIALACGAILMAMALRQCLRPAPRAASS